MPLPQNYNAKDFEDKIYQKWIENDVGNPDKQLSDNENYLILDCDGVLADSWESEIQARIESGLAINRQEAILFQTKRHSKSPFKKDGQNKKELMDKTSQWHEIKYAYFQKTNSYKPFEEFITELKNLKNTKFSVISSNSDKIVRPFCKSLDLDFTHILSFKDSPSKEEKLIKIAKDWGVDPTQIKFITDTKSDVLELENILPKENLFGVQWGFHGGKSLQEIQEFTPDFKGLEEVLPDQQILFNFKELYKVFNQSNNENSKTHTILMPPPNLTGNMHAGHSFQHFLMDTLSRLARQRGDLDLWYPGVDHAGIQLEGVIDKLIKKGDFDEIINSKSSLSKELEGIDKSEIPQFIKKNDPELWLSFAWQKANEWRNNQQNQAKVLGDTPDYSRQLFTLDERANDMVYYAFEKYWKDGLIYKGAYLVNWSVGLQTALSDVTGEIEFETRIDPFVTFEYEVKKIEIGDEKLKIKFHSLIQNYLKPVTSWPRLKLSTVRPETKFTDLAVAMHPSKINLYFNNDLFEIQKPGFDNALAKEFIESIKNYKVAVLYHLPALESGELKLIFSQKIDPNFGTGILKVTPAHDQFDYDLYKEFVEKGILEGGKIQTSIGRDGKLTPVCGQYSGLTTEQGRLAVIKRLAETGYIPLKDEFILEKENVLTKVKSNLESESFDPTDYSYEEGQKRLIELLSEAGTKLEINWNYEHNVSLCERSKTVIEPLISEEFFLSYSKEFQHNPLSPFAANPLKNYSANEINLLPPDPLDKGSLGKSNPESVADFKRFSYNPKLKDHAKEMLNNPTPSESIVWENILKSEKTGFKFLRQQIIDNYILDFYCSELLLAIEIDRDVHENFETVEYDKIRDQFLTASRITVVRIKNSEINQLDTVEKKIKSAITKQTNSSHPLSRGLGGSKTTLQKLGLEGILETTFFSPQYKEMAENFVNNIKDWCISRDLTWGHRIPVWYNLDVNPEKKFLSYSDLNDPSHPLSGGLGGSKLAIKIQPNKPTEPGTWVQEEKILDTWFSSCLWPLSTLGFYEYAKNSYETEPKLPLSRGLEGTTDFQRFYPTQEMTTAKEIFYLWIVRMIVLGKYFTGTIPFETVIITPTILDDKGRKMSKSLGNGLDPVDAIHKYSSDALRLAMLGGMIPNRNMKMGGALADTLMEKYRNFGNKIWNVGRFLDL